MNSYQGKKMNVGETVATVTYLAKSLCQIGSYYKFSGGKNQYLE